MERITLSKTSGVYKIMSLKTGRIYVGSAIDLKVRKYFHFHSLMKGTHYNTHLQNHYNEYGENDLCFSVIELCQKENLVTREQFWIDKLNLFAADNDHLRFNIISIARSQLGYKHRDDVKLKYGLSMKEWYKTEDGLRDKDIKRNKFKGDGNPMKDPVIAKKNKENANLFVRPVEYYDLNDNYIGEFKSLVEACSSLGIFRANIISCIKGTHRIKSAGGYRWKYKAA
jgi:group I intron endonuclease